MVGPKTKRSSIPESAKPIPGHDGYFAEKTGIIWGPLGRALKPQLDRYGYPHVRPRNRTIMVHSLILLTFVGPRPDGMECRHLDNNRANCDLSNLKWDTKLANMGDKKKFGTTAAGERHPHTKLTDIQAREIWELPHRDGALVAKRYGIVRDTVWNIWSRRGWKHLDLPQRPPEAYGRKLTELNVREIMSLRGKQSSRELASRFGVHYTYINKLWAGSIQVWKPLHAEFEQRGTG